MPIPSPRKGQSKKDFIKVCMSDNVMVREFDDQAQRYAICLHKFEDKKKKASLSFSIGDDEFIVVEDETSE